ncbi:MAG: hypothetical protein ACK4NF_01295 [Planctomycetota bacterium]
MKLINFLLLVCIFSISCKSDNQGKKILPIKEGSTPEKTFEEINKALIRGDLETVYFYLSTNQKKAITLEELKINYEKYKDIWIAQAKNARIVNVAIDEQEGRASAVIYWGLGDNTIATFILEDGIWREDTFIPLNK